MTDAIKDILKRYDEIAAIILDQKVDEFSDRIGEKPEGTDDATFEEYIQRLAKDEIDEATKVLEEEPDEKLGGKSMHQIFDEMTLDEKFEALEYCAVDLDRSAPACLQQAIADDPDREAAKLKCAEAIGDAAWTDDELADEDKIFEMEFQKAKSCLEVLTKMGEACYVKAVLDRFMSYPQTKDFVADSIAGYIEAFPEVSVPFLTYIIETNEDTGLEGPCEDVVIMLTAIGKEQPSEEIYDALRRAFRYMKNKIYAVLCLADYGDKRAASMFKNYINRNQDTIDRELFYEMMSAIQNLGGDISDIHDPFGDFRKKMQQPEKKPIKPAGYNGNK